MEEIVKLCKGEIILTVNDHRSSYTTIRKYIKELIGREWIDEGQIGEEMIKKMEENDRFYQLQFYPQTPIGFYTVFGSCMDDVIQEAKSILVDELNK